MAGVLDALLDTPSEPLGEAATPAARTAMGGGSALGISPGTGRFNPELHPRDPNGKWTHALHALTSALKKSATAKHPLGEGPATVVDSGPGRPRVMIHSVKGAAGLGKQRFVVRDHGSVSVHKFSAAEKAAQHALAHHYGNVREEAGALDALLPAPSDDSLAERAEVGKPGTNWTQVSPAARKKVEPLVRHWMGHAHPWQACVDELGPEKGMEAAKRICSVVKDMGMRTTKWRKGGKHKLSEDEQRELDIFIAARCWEAEERLEAIDAELGMGASASLAEQASTGDELLDPLREMAWNDRCLLYLTGHMEEREFDQAKRSKLAKSGHAMKDGSYPIESKGDLSNAVQAFGRAKPGKRSALRAHIRKHARRLGVQVPSLAEAETGASAFSLRQVASANNERARHEVHMDGQHVGYLIERRRGAYSSEPQVPYFQSRALNGDSIAENEPSQSSALAALRQHLTEAPSRVRQQGDRWLVAKPRTYGETEYMEYPSEDSARHAAGLPPARVTSTVAEGATFDPSKHPKAGKGSPAGGQFIAKGSSGSETKAVQGQVGAKQDGQFGAKTEAKVRAYQKAHGLTVDGKVGHQTAAALSGKKNASKVKTGALTAADRKAITGKGKAPRLGSTVTASEVAEPLLPFSSTP